MHILIAPNAFKNSLPAMDVAIAIEKGLNQSRLKFTSECFPVGDGGDGTGLLLANRLKGVYVNMEAMDPLRRKINASFALVDDGNTAIIELAVASGIRLLKEDEKDPLYADTYGTGQLIKHALDKNVQKIILCIGGSATIDGATGILLALGVRFLDNKDLPLNNLPADLVSLASIDLSGLDKRIKQCEFIIMCDVENPLLGSNGAAAVFGPQKGATPENIRLLDAALEKYSEVTHIQTGKNIAGIKYGGAAGGTAAGLYAYLGATLVDGIDYFLSVTSFENSLKKADLLITGEGSIDDQTLQGKGPVGLARKAKEKGIPVIALGGSVPLEESKDMQKHFDILLPIGNAPVEMKIAIEHTRENLTRTARQIGNLINLGSGLL